MMFVVKLAHWGQSVDPSLGGETMKKVLLLFMLGMLLSSGVTWQAQSQNEATEAEILAAEQGVLATTSDLQQWDRSRFGAYLNYNIPGSTFLINIVAQRSEGTQRAQARISYKFSTSSPLRLTRVDFLSPQELAGDVYIIRSNEDSRRLSEVFFWNPGLVSALKIDGGFEVFGDVNVFEVIGLKLGDGQYGLVKKSFSDVEPTIPAPETNLLVGSPNSLRRIVTEARLAEFVIEPIPARRETVPFSKIKVLAFLDATTSLYEIQLMDESGDLLQTINYDWREFRELVPDSGQGRYAEVQVVENHVIPGNITHLTISNIEIKNFPEEMFDPNQLGQ